MSKYFSNLRWCLRNVWYVGVGALIGRDYVTEVAIGVAYRQTKKIWAAHDPAQEAHSFMEWVEEAYPASAQTAHPSKSSSVQPEFNSLGK